MAVVRTAKKSQLFKGYPDVLTVKDLQRALHIGKTAAYGLLESKHIQSFKIGRIYKIPKTALIGYVQSSED
jgi:excisionase family DNA binding protein